MSYTQADLDAIRAMKAKGASELEMSNGERVRFRSLSEMNQIEAEIEASLGQSTSPTHFNPVFSKGV